MERNGGQEAVGETGIHQHKANEPGVEPADKALVLVAVAEPVVREDGAHDHQRSMTLGVLEYLRKRTERDRIDHRHQHMLIGPVPRIRFVPDVDHQDEHEKTLYT